GNVIPLKSSDDGYYTGTISAVKPGDRYFYILDHEDRYPDPASRFQPEGVHGPSQVVDPNFHWDDYEWKGLPMKAFIIYELHVGTFTSEGTFEAIIPRLDYLKDLGITAIELMPVTQFPGNRNWGYDGVYPFAPQNTYGGPSGLKKLVNTAHKKGLAVIFDVVYNHLGPEGNYLSHYGPYFTDKYKNPWGEAINFDGPYSNEVRSFFISNALYWINEYHVDALRLDAVDRIYDFSARHFLEELCGAVHAEAKTLRKEIAVIAESDLNDVRILNPSQFGGYGLDAQWNDDFHHSIHALLTKETSGYYEDFGDILHLDKAFREGFVYSGEYSRVRKRNHGNSSKERPPEQLVVFSQSHDQVGNRMAGDRLSETQSLEKLKLVAGTVILSPFVPLLFMGEEYGETAPFQYFISHSDSSLIQAVRKGRRDEFACIEGKEDVPDPQAESTFLHSKLTPDLYDQGRHKVLFAFYKELIRMRKEITALSHLSKESIEVKSFEDEKTLTVRRWFKRDSVFYLFNFGAAITRIGVLLPEGTWVRIFESSCKKWDGHGDAAHQEIVSDGSEITFNLAPYSLVLYRMSEGGC
ncbi:MAG: malto-oligosyltrehalose trehalohydrolase, partial [Dissulfurispiraceae bacterium]